MQPHLQISILDRWHKVWKNLQKIKTQKWAIGKLPITIKGRMWETSSSYILCSTRRPIPGDDFNFQEIFWRSTSCHELFLSICLHKTCMLKKNSQFHTEYSGYIGRLLYIKNIVIPSPKQFCWRYTGGSIQTRNDII